MKTYFIQNEDQIPKNIKDNTKAIQIIFKNIKKRFYKDRSPTDKDLFLFEASPIPLQMKTFDLNFIIMFVNVKNEYGEFFSSLVDNLSENDIIVIIDAIIVTKNDNYHVKVQPENNPSVFLFKMNSFSLESNLSKEENLSKISGTGIYSLFGYVRKTAISADKECMWVRIKSSDLSCINILRYPFNLHDTRKQKNYKKYSKIVDILTENPCNDFISLVRGQQILLRNVKVSRVDNSNCFLLCVQGITDHLKTITMNNNTNNLSLLQQQSPIINKLTPSTGPKSKPITFHTKLKPLSTSYSKNKCITNIPNFPLNYNVNSLPYNDDELLSDFVKNTDGKVKKRTQCLTRKKRIRDSTNINYSPRKTVEPNSQSDTEVNNFKRINRIKNIRKCSPNDDGMYFFLSSNDPDIFDSNKYDSGPHLQVLHLSYLDKEKSTKGCSIRCIGPCRPINIEPYLILNDNDSSDFLSGYCEKCFTFTPISYLITQSTHSNEEYTCPMCHDPVYLNFFFSLNFLYGNNETQALKICCYGENAERFLKTLSQKSIKVEHYRLDQNCRKLVVDNMRKFILEKTKVNLVVMSSPLDNAFILMSISTNNVSNT